MNFPTALSMFIVLWTATELNAADLTAQKAKVPAVYEMGNFYYYDEAHKIKPLPLQSKVFVLYTGDLRPKKWLAENKKLGNLVDYDHDQKIGTLKKGALVTFKDNRQAMAGMESLHKEKLPYYPIVTFDTMACIPSDSILVETKMAVTQDVLVKRIESAYGLKYRKVEHVVNNVYVIHDIEGGGNPPNTMALAALMAEDTAWFKQARPLFIPLHRPVEAFMTIENPAVADLGNKRVLKLTVKVYHHDAKVRKDLLPVLGRAGWLPTAWGNGQPKDDAWYDFDEPTIVEYTNSGVTTIEVICPFRFLHNATCYIGPAKVIYEIKGKESSVTAPGINYGVSSFLSGSGIEDLQPIRSLPPMPAEEATPEFSESSYPWSSSGFVATVLGGLLSLLGLAGLVSRFMANHAVLGKARSQKYALIEALNTAAKKVRKAKKHNWREAYFAVNAALAGVMAEVYKQPQPQASADVQDDLLRMILAEIEKAYAAEATPNATTLYENLYEFVRKSYKHV